MLIQINSKIVVYRGGIKKNNENNSYFLLQYMKRIPVINESSISNLFYYQFQNQ